MKIGIIGAGHIGGTLARRLTELGHDVTVANSRGPDTLKDLAAKTGARAATVEEAAKDKEVVIVTIPEKSVPDLAGSQHQPDADVGKQKRQNCQKQQKHRIVAALTAAHNRALEPGAHVAQQLQPISHQHRVGRLQEGEDDAQDDRR